MRNQKLVKEFIALESLKLCSPVQPSSDGKMAAKRGCPRRFRISSVCFSDPKYYFEEIEIRVKVNYDFGDRHDGFILMGKLIGESTDLNVEVAPKKDINHKEGRCSYTIISPNNETIGISLILELLY